MFDLISALLQDLTDDLSQTKISQTLFPRRNLMCLRDYFLYLLWHGIRIHPDISGYPDMRFLPLSALIIKCI